MPNKMLSNIKLLIKYFFYGGVFLIAGVASYQIASVSGNTSFEIGDYTIYIQNNTLIAISLLFLYLFAKFLSILFFFEFGFYKLKSAFVQKIAFLKSEKILSEQAIISQIMQFKAKKRYKEGLNFTYKHLYMSSKCFFWHLFFLLKLKKDKEFFKLFMQKPIGESVKLFILIYIPRNIMFFKGFFLKRLYLKNMQNQAISYIYANYLYSINKNEEAQKILKRFLYEKKIFITDAFCTYLMNLLAIKIEAKLGGSSYQDFTLNYKDNIDFYHESKKERSI